MDRTSTRRPWRVAGFGLVFVLGACTDTALAPSVAPQFNEVTGNEGTVRLCKSGPDGTVATFTITADGPGNLPLGSEVTVPAKPLSEDCTPGVNEVVVWTADPNSTETTQVTITETSDNDLVWIAYRTSTDDWAYDYDNNFVTLTVSNDIWGRARFKNNSGPPPPPPGGSEGCTPGYWKQSQHFDSWVDYSPSDLFDDVFGRAAFPGQTLLDVLSNGGGGLNALGRHTVAAVLDAASSDVDYGYAAADVIQMFQDAYDSGDYETQKDLFDEWNNRGCPLD